MEELGLYLPEILLPREGVDLTKWAVIACDQYTSERDYWEKVKEFVGDSPSTLHMIFPECYLEEEDTGTRINRIQSVMRQYLREEVLSPQPPGLVLVNRQTWYASRNGLLVAVDLEEYSYEKTACGPAGGGAEGALDPGDGRDYSQPAAAPDKTTGGRAP